MTDMHIHARKKIDPEEFEQHMVTREGQRDSLLDYHVVERVIGSREGDEEDEYYVKCECECFTPWSLPNCEKGKDCTTTIAHGKRLP